MKVIYKRKFVLIYENGNKEARIVEADRANKLDLVLQFEKEDGVKLVVQSKVFKSKKQ